jgi:S-adenosylmethionine decarboxylase proenzyme
MHSLGRHALLDLYGCNPDILNDAEYLQSLFKQTALDLKCTVIQEVFHHFAPHGVSGVVVIAESHLAIHTWPEYGYAAVDLFTCSETTELEALGELLRERLQAGEIHFREEARGVVTDQRMALLRPRVAAST